MDAAVNGGDGMLQKVERVTVTDSIVDQLLDKIQNGVFQPGDKVPSEPELAKGLGVGRTSVREALKALQVLGLIERRHDGTFVSENATPTLLDRILQSGFLTRHLDIVHIFEARRILECEIGALAAQRMNRQILGRLEVIHAQMEATAPEDFDTYFELDMKFHHHIAVAAANPVLKRMWSLIQDLLEGVQADIRTTPNIKAQTKANHERLLEAFHRKDAVTVRNVIQSSLNAIESLIIQTDREESNDE